MKPHFASCLLLALQLGAWGESPADGEGLAQSLGRAKRLASQVTITRDEFGSPHVHAPTDAGAVFGGMYARAEDEMSRIEIAYARMIGRAALVGGPGDLAWDWLVLSFEVPDRARRVYEAAPAEVRALAEAAADALNLYRQSHPDELPRAIEQWKPWMLVAGYYSWPLYQAQKEARRVLAQRFAPAAAPSTLDGSNAWALAPARTASGRALLYINPHIPLDEPYEMHLRSDEGLHISGMVAYGLNLLPMVGFNEHLGWSLTVNQVDIVDAYAVEFDLPGDPLAYHHGTEVRRATRWTATVPVRTARGVEHRDLTLSKTHHGPLLGQVGGKSIAIRVARVENLKALEQWYRMARARDMAAWREAVSMLSAVFHNLVYADGQGNIGYIYHGAVPRRDPAFEWSEILDGSDPRTEWQDYHRLDELPQVWNPPCGYVQNCNSPPLLTCAKGQNPAAEDFPAYMIGKDIADGRVAMSRKILSGACEWRLEDLERAAFDTAVYTMDGSRARLLADYAGLREKSPDLAAGLAAAIKQLGDWDGRLTKDSVASTLFVLWIEKAFSPGWAKRRAQGDLCAALAEVIADLNRGFATWQVAWGEINRHQRFNSWANVAVRDDAPSLPIAGGQGGLGVSFCYLSRARNTQRRYGYHGHSYVAAVEFSDPPAARSIVPFGQSRHAESPHYSDQAPLYAAGRFKTARFSAAQVKAGAQRSYHPGQ